MKKRLKRVVERLRMAGSGSLTSTRSGLEQPQRLRASTVSAKHAPG